jgi:hypothetical protein
VDAGSSGTRLNLAVDPECKVNDEKKALNDKALLNMTFTKKMDGKFNNTSAEKFY